MRTKHFMLKFAEYCDIALFSLNLKLRFIDFRTTLLFVNSSYLLRKQKFFEFIELCFTGLRRNFHKKAIFENVRLEFLNFDLKSVINSNEKFGQKCFHFMH
jgi:hypothetical protein